MEWRLGTWWLVITELSPRCSQSSVLDVHKPALLVSGVTGGTPVHVKFTPSVWSQIVTPLPSLWSRAYFPPTWLGLWGRTPWHCDWSRGQWWGVQEHWALLDRWCETNFLGLSFGQGSPVPRALCVSHPRMLLGTTLELPRRYWTGLPLGRLWRQQCFRPYSAIPWEALISHRIPVHLLPAPLSGELGPPTHSKSAGSSWAVFACMHAKSL